LVLILTVPVAVTFALVSDPWLHLFNSSYSLAKVVDYEVPFLDYQISWMNVVWTAYCYVVGVALTFVLAIRLNRELNKVVLYLFISGVGICYGLNLGSIVYVDLRVMPMDGLSFTFVTLFFYTGALGFGYFDIAPVARKKMLDVIKDAIFVLDAQGSITDVNTAGAILVGKERNELLRNPPSAIFSMFPDLRELIERKEAFTNVETGDGLGKTYNVDMIPFQYGKMGQLGNMLVINDTTERKKAEKKFQMAETRARMAEVDRKYRTLVDNQTESIITFDSLGTITFGNPVFDRILKKIGKEVPGANISDIMGANDCDTLWTLIRLATVERPEFQMEHMITLSDEDVQWIHWQGKAIFDPNGIMHEIQAAGMDITEKKNSEAEYQAIVECQKEMIVRRTKAGRINFANQAFSGYFNIPIEELIGTSFFPPAEETDINVFMEAISALTKENPDHDFLILRVFLKDGSTRFTEWKVRGIFDSRGRLIEYQSVGNDITEKMKMEQELVKTQKLESIGILAGGIAHDFNNLLSSIVSNIEVAITETKIEAGQLHRLDEAVRTALSARRLTQQLLTFSTGGKPVKEAIDIATMLRPNIEFTLAGSNVKAEYRIAPDLWHISADPFQVGQVVNNLVINAIQAMPDGGQITVDASNVDGTCVPVELTEGTDYVKISIRDTGTGIPEPILNKIFDPFFTTKKKGTGLGLSTVQSIVKNHHGHIQVESRLGSGTTFSIYLPSCQPEPLPSPEMVPNMAKPQQAKILIMDDDESILDVLSIILADMGHSVEMARTGEEAIESVSLALSGKGRFDLVIMDLTIKGGMGGKDAIGHIRKLDPTLQVIVSSGYSNDPVMSDPHRYGFNDFLQKPYTIQEIREKLSVMLGKQSDHIQQVSPVEYRSSE
jgi:PAS domain S-box-containing protein